MVKTEQPAGGSSLCIKIVSKMLSKTNTEININGTCFEFVLEHFMYIPPINDSCRALIPL
jgi:hypothetical protein